MQNLPSVEYMPGEDGQGDWYIWAGHFVERGSKRVWIMGNPPGIPRVIPWGSAQAMKMSRGIFFPGFPYFSFRFSF